MLKKLLLLALSICPTFGKAEEPLPSLQEATIGSTAFFAAMWCGMQCLKCCGTATHRYFSTPGQVNNLNSFLTNIFVYGTKDANKEARNYLYLMAILLAVAEYSLKNIKIN